MSSAHFLPDCIVCVYVFAILPFAFSQPRPKIHIACMKMHLLAHVSDVRRPWWCEFEIIGLVFVMNFRATPEQANKRLI